MIGGCEPLSVPIQMFDFTIEQPCYAHDGDAGLDLRSTQSLVLEPFQRATIPCGFAIAIPEGYAGLVIPRSGLASRHGISVVNAPGLIDSNYRGEIGVVLINLDPVEPFAISVGDRIAQLAIVPVPSVRLTAQASLDSTVRGPDGFGSSGR